MLSLSRVPGGDGEAQRRDTDGSAQGSQWDAWDHLFFLGKNLSFPWAKRWEMSPLASTALPSMPREGVHPLGWGVGVLHRPGAQTLTEMSLMRRDGPQSILQPHSPSAAEVPAHALATEVGETLAGGCNSADRAFPFGPRGRGSGQ